MDRTARLSPQPWMTAPETRAVLDALAAGGVEARFVGGCVRDGWLGRPVKDIDVASPAPPERVMELLQAAGVAVIPTGLAHGTVTALVNRVPFEITTLRHDVESYGRHARVAFTDDWEADAARRDLTMNALSCAPDGTIHDFFGGLEDMAAGHVRFVGDARRRIREDVLRLLRFFRFHAHYGRGEPDRESLAACTELAPLLPTLSGERIQAETLRLLGALNPVPVWRLMIEAGILHHLLPDATDVGRLSGLVWLESALAEPAAPIRRLAAALVTDRPGALAVAEALRLSNADRDRLAALVEPPQAVCFADHETKRRHELYRLGSAGLYQDLVLLSAVGASGPVSLDGVRAALATADVLPYLRFPLAGRDLLALGLAAGPAMGALLKAVEGWWIAEDFRPGREACLEEARRLSGVSSASP